MTVGQLELPLFDTRSTPGNPVPEQDRTHPAVSTVREMELRTYDCGIKQQFHPSHPHPRGGACPGLSVVPCGNETPHRHHRWWVLGETFHWCNGTHQARRIVDVELP